MTTGAPLLPITKTGPGDKQKAYIVRQNVFLKAMLGLLIFVGTLSTTLLLTMYEVRMQKRGAVHEAREHREEEHTSHMRVLRLSMMLQAHLKDEIHDERMLTQYRAWLMKSVGNYQSRVMMKACPTPANCTTGVVSGLSELGTDFDSEIDRLMKGLWEEVVQEGKKAQGSLHNITHALVAELRQDATEQGEYEKLMAEMGEHAGRFGYHEHHEDSVEEHAAHGNHHHHDRHHKHMWHDDAEHGGEERDDPYEHGRSDGSDEEDDNGGRPPYDQGDEEARKEDEDEEEHLAGALEALMARLQEKDLALDVDNATIARWVELQASSEKALSDDEQEVDMDRVGERIELAMNASHAGVPPYNASEFGTQLDWLTAMIHRARLAPYQMELLQLLVAWHEGETKISLPLKRIEELIDAEVLEPDVLLVHGDYEHYRYDD